MARKSTKPKPDTDGILRTGIFQRDCRPRKKTSLAKSLEQMREQALNPPPRLAIHQWLDQHVKFFAEILRPHVNGPGNGHAMNMGDGWQRYELAKDAPEECHDAIKGMDTVYLLQRHLDSKGNLDGDIALVIKWAHDLGQTVLKIRIRPFEPLAMSGRKATIDRPKAMRRGKAAHDATENRRKRQEAKEELALDRRRFPETTKETIRKSRVAKKLRIHVGTLNNRLRKTKVI